MGVKYIYGLNSSIFLESKEIIGGNRRWYFEKKSFVGF